MKLPKKYEKEEKRHDKAMIKALKKKKPSKCSK